MNEIWKTIPYAPSYEVSNLGRICSNKGKHRKILKQKIYKNGYYAVGLCFEKNKRKWYLVHRIVLSVFRPVNNMGKLEVNHIDENKMNNCLDNLEWSTSKYNCNYGKRNETISDKLSKKVLCVETGNIYNSFHDAARITGIGIAGINMCCNGRYNRKTAGGYHWKYV